MRWGADVASGQLQDFTLNWCLDVDKGRPFGAGPHLYVMYTTLISLSLRRQHAVHRAIDALRELWTSLYKWGGKTRQKWPVVLRRTTVHV
jgi:hypothetical protein